MDLKKLAVYIKNYKIIQQQKKAAQRFLEYCKENAQFRQKHSDIYYYVKQNGISMYPYDWFGQIGNLPLEKVKRCGGGYKYVIYKGKKLYYDRCFQDMEIVNGLNFYEKEQHPLSPHCYQPSEDRCVRKGDVVVECGASEGTFSLSVIDQAKKIYIFEGDPRFRKGLEKTFKAYKDKVQIIYKFVDSYPHGQFTTIDSCVKEKINFLKMDIEGYEAKALYGARETIKSSDNLRMSVCAYHNSEDYDLIGAYLRSLGCTVAKGNGYVFKTDSSLYESDVPQLRQGMIFADK